MTFPDFEEFIASLNAHRVRYLIVGGYAVAFHARPRATKDLDVLVDPTAANARRVRAAIAEFFGEAPANITLKKLQNPRTLIILGVAPVRIDILTSVDGISSFRAAWQRRVEGRFGQTPSHFASHADLVRSKLAAGRPQDLADVDVLERALERRSKTQRPRRKPRKA